MSETTRDLLFLGIGHHVSKIKGMLPCGSYSKGMNKKKSVKSGIFFSVGRAVYDCVFGSRGCVTMPPSCLCQNGQNCFLKVYAAQREPDSICLARCALCFFSLQISLCVFKTLFK